MSSPWIATPEAGRIGPSGTLALVDGATFVISSPNGDVSPDQPHGFFVRDTRVLSQLVVEVDDRPLTPVSTVSRGPFSVSVVTRAHHSLYPHHADQPLTILRHRTVSEGVREVLELRNHSIHGVELVLSVSCDADFASLFDVKADVQDPDITAAVGGEAGRLLLEPADAGPDGIRTEVTLDPAPDERAGGRLSWRLELAPGAEQVVTIEVRVADGAKQTGAGPNPAGPPSVVARIVRDPAEGVRFTATDGRLEGAASQALEDLAVLRIFDPAHTDRVVVAAGAPWFMALFGRDSIITAWMALIADQRLAAGVLLALADAQGTVEVPETEEQPGRILHEVRYDRRSVGLLGGANVYYGTVDATPLFVMLVAEYLRWTDDRELVARLMPAVDAALEWIATYGDLDGDGFVEYQRLQGAGLANQGWKDSWDGIRYGDGRVAEAPIALCEVQAYVYGAYRAMAYLRDIAGDQHSAATWNRRADELQEAFDGSFWLADRGTYAVGLDPDKRPIDSVTSNVGHCLWTGIVPEHRAEGLAERLVSPEMFSGWGVRTLSEDNPGFNPLSYHCGSVWPHDTALVVAGLDRYGFHTEAARLRSGLLDVAFGFGFRLPELFAGFARSELPSPVVYPASCSPQAWAAAAPLLMIRSMIGLDPDLPRGTVGLRRDPAGAALGLRVEGLALGGATVTVAVDDDGPRLEGDELSATIELR
ncbi:MAG: trehalase family glycosidase [Acidimicrobiia bacterium]|nr:trehalase family glycosidase [Acidimicrobiia bacterium]